MKAILELQRQLKEAQSQKNKSGHKLNERNAVDIIRILIESNKLQLIYTQDGKEYLTHSQLKKEIQDLVEVYSGRMELKDMPAHLGVGIESIQSTIEQLIFEKKGLLINDSFVTPKYEISLVEDLASMVQDKGCVELSDLTNKYWLPHQFIRDAIAKNSEILPKGCIVSNTTIISSSFSERQLCKVRGILRAITRPTSINNLSTRFQLDELKLKVLAEQLIKSGEVKGKIQKGQYVPTSFSELQLNTVQSVYRQNSYVTLSLLDKLQVQQPSIEFLKKACPDIIILKNVAFSETLYQNIEQQLNILSKKPSHASLYDILPEFLHNEEEIQHLLQIINADVRLMPDGHQICSTQFLNKCLGWFKNISESEASKLIRQGFTSVVESQEQAQEESKTNKKKKGSKKPSEPKSEQNEKSEVDRILCPITNKQIIEILEQNKVEKELIQTLAGFLGDPIKLQYKNIFLETLASSTGKASAKQSASLEQQAEQRFQLLKYILKQIEKMRAEDGDKSALSAIQSSLCKTQGVQLLSETIQLQAFHNEITVEKTVAATLKKFQKHIREIFQTLESKLESKDLVGFVGFLSDEIKNLGFRLGKTGPLDKKLERQMKTDLLQQFKEQSDNAIANLQVDEALSNTIHYLCVNQGCYTGLEQEKEEWALKICANLLDQEKRLTILNLMSDKSSMGVDQFMTEIKQLIQ